MELRTNKFLSNDLILFILLSLIFFAIRLPFLFFLPGYGADPDAWRVIYAAQKIASSGSYHVSRLPGYPVHEIACALFLKFPPVFLNGLTLFFSSFSAAFFSLILKHFKSGNIFLAGLALSFIPIIFVNSFVTLDYLWALAFITGSLYFILKQKILTAGILLGLATGCRITSIAMCLPLALMLLQSNKNYRRLLIFILTATLTGAVCFTPVFLKYGFGFLSYNQSLPISIKKLTDRLFFQVWGDIGVYFIAGSLLIQTILILTAKIKAKLKITASPLTVSCFLSILLYTACFLKLPDEAAYLIPAIPFAIFLLNMFLNKTLFIIVCLSIAVSPFFTLQKKYAAPFPARYYQRVYRQNTINSVSEFINQNNDKTVIVCFDWYPFLSVGLDKSTKNKTTLMFSLEKTMLKEFIANGFKVYYIPNNRETTYLKNRMTLKANGAEPLFN